MKTKRIIFLCLSLLMYMNCIAQQKVTVSGVVTSADDKETLIGVTVREKGTSNGTVTDFDGKYSITVPQGATLVYSFVGMNPVEVIADQSVIDVAMSSGVDLEEVVVIGYGGAKKSDLTGSVSTLSTKDLMANNPLSVNQGLQGKVAGVNVTQTDGAPGSGVNILIRGANSFTTSAEPLYIVDGIPFETSSTPSSDASGSNIKTNALSLINPNDIENITILKDASSTAIYGSRGANGVILITTKKGRIGKDRIELNVNLGFSKVVKQLDVLNGGSYTRYRNEQVANSNFYDGASLPVPYPDKGYIDNTTNSYVPSPEDFDNGYLNGGTNWQDEIFQTGYIQEYGLNYSGASEKGNYSVSGGYADQKGIVHSSAYKRMNIRTNINRYITPYLTIGTSTAVTRTAGNFTKTNADDNGIIRSALWFPSDRPVFDENADGGFSQVDWFAANPYVYTRDATDQIITYNIFSSNYFEVTFLKDFKFRQNLGINYVGNDRYTYYGQYTLEGKAPRNGLAGQADNWNTGLTSESILTYDKDLNEIHHFNVMGAFTAERGDYGFKSATAYDFDNDYMKMYNLAAGKKQEKPKSGRGMASLASVLGRFNYELMNKYLFTASFRFDGSSKFKKENRWSFFPSFAIAWRASEESFIKDLDIFSNLKFRASYGETGNQGIGSYQTVSSLSSANTALNGTIVGGGVDSYLNNEDLIWETTQQMDFGFDMGFWGNRLNFTIDLYKKNTSDLLQNLIIPNSTGFSTKIINSGNIINKGIEFSVNAYILDNVDFKWNINANMAFNRNEISNLDDDQFAANLGHNIDQVFIQRAGKPIGAIFGYVEDGFYDNEAEVRADPDYKNASSSLIQSKIGEIKYKDMDGKEGITADDRVIIGNVNPDFTYGFTNNLQWKGFSMNLFFQGTVGNDIFNGNKIGQTMSSIGNITQEAYDTRWTADHFEYAKWPKAYAGIGRTIKISDRYVEDGSYFRLKSASLSYNFKSPIKEIETIGLTFMATNLFTITNYSWYDPDVNSFGGDTSRRGVDMYTYPSSRTYSLSLRVVF